MNQHGQVDTPSSEPPSGDFEQDPFERRFQVSLANEQSTLAVDEQRLIAAVRAVLQESSYTSATVSIAVVDDPTIHRLNVEFLEHDYPTDVLSFVLEDEGDVLEGELVISAETAAHNAEEFGWSTSDEMTLYAIHGSLHLVGYDDQTPTDEAKMREAEARFLQHLSVRLPEGRSRWSQEIRPADQLDSRDREEESP